MGEPAVSVQHIATHRDVTALRWEGEELVDFADGPDRWRLDGTADLPRVISELGRTRTRLTHDAVL